MRQSLCAAAMLGSLLFCAARISCADWEEPKDGKFTEKQLELFIAAHGEWVQYQKAAAKALEGSKGFGGIGAVTTMNEKLKSIMDKHGLKLDEYAWLSSKVGGCTGIALVDDMMDKGKTETEELKKKNSAEIAAGKAKIAAYEAALKNGTRVLTPERREELVKQAKEQETSALEEAKTHTDEAKAAADEAAKAESEAKAADALAQKPPADVEADSKAEYSKGKKEEADNFRTAAKEVREKEKEARKLEAESKAKAAGFARQAAQPEIPVTREDKEQVKTDNTQGLESARTELETLKQATQFLAENDVAREKQIVEYHKSINEENLALVKKHYKEIQKALGMDEKK